MGEKEDEAQSDGEFAFSVEDVHAVTSSAPSMKVKIGGIAIDALIDSGSVSNMISERDFQNLEGKGLKVSVAKCEKQFYAYGGRPVDVVGQFCANLSVGDVSVIDDIVIVKKGRCLIGHGTAVKLNVLHIGPLPFPSPCNSVEDSLDEQLKTHYPQVFEGIGKLKDFKLKLHTDEEVIPVAPKLRRIPFALRNKVTAKVTELIREDIVEKVIGPSKWVSPVVVVPKPSGEVRLCVDMRQANQAIIRERLPIPIVDEVLEELNGSTVFSKLDLRMGFHQIELEEESRDITTCITHDGLYRFKRLSFGVNAAPEIYQHIISQAFADIPGVTNIADDLVVHGSTKAEHDSTVHRVMKRLEERQLTLNPEKCSFRMEKIEFMGLLLSKHGVGPTQERVRDVLETRRPTSAAEVRSFLGMVGFSARFIPDFATTAEPLRAIARKGESFVWGTTQQESFELLKKQLAEAAELAFFDKEAHITVITDASPVGLGAVLVQERNGESRAVCYASRSLSSVERRYSQTEKEALAIVWACERFHLYLYGLQEFDLMTDHQALKVLYSRGSKYQQEWNDGY